MDNEYFEEIITIIEAIDIYKKKNQNSPIVVHCSGGVGRTGTFICLYNIYKELIEQLKNKNVIDIKFSIMNLVRKIKEMRMHSVENQAQYASLYNFANYLLLKYNK